jgi:hypothetical protein
MIRNSLSILLICITTLLFGQKKNDIIKEINSYKTSLVKNASFNHEFSEVWNAIYVIASEEYNTIKRESESRGYIEAAQESDTYKEFMTIEIRGDEAPYRISFQVKQEKRTKNEDGTFSSWQTYRSASLSNYYFKLRKRLYELLNGPIQLSDVLQKKVDNFNAVQTKERKKILKGKHY